jgi:uridine kinase
VEQQRQSQQAVSELNRLRKEERQKIQQAIYLSKREEVQQTKMVKRTLEQRKRSQDNSLNAVNRQKNAAISHQKQVAQMRIEQEKRRRID